MQRIYKMLLIVFLILGCGQDGQNGQAYDEKLNEKAAQIAQSTIILDGHIDVPDRLHDNMEDVSQATEKGDFDYPRAQQGGLDVPFMSIYIPAGLQQTPGASKKRAEELIAMMDSIATANSEKFAKAVSTADVEKNFENGLISFAYGMENGSGIEDDLANVAYFYDKGIRYITLTHSKKNLICDSSYDPDKGWNGLSPFGKKVVDEMNRLGIMVDISHVSDSTFYQVLRLSKVPVICSHSSSRHFTPGFERNVSDDMLQALAKNGGVIQINFGSAFLMGEANQYSTKQWTQVQQMMDEKGITSFNHPDVQAAVTAYREENPYPYSHIQDVVDHIDHVVKLVGIEHVGIGSDFDGVGDSLPIGLKSVADYPNLIYHLLERGYSEENIGKILSGNVLRAWRAVENYANPEKMSHDSN